MRRNVVFLVLAYFMTTTFVSGQSPDYGNLDPKPFDPSTEPNPDMFIKSWKESLPVHRHGSIIQREILFKNDGDPMRPKQKGAVLTNLKRFNHGIIQSLTTTGNQTLAGEQEIFYIDSGKGIVKSKTTTAELYPGIGVIVPPGVEFSITNTETEPLSMYIITENIPDGFEPQQDIVVRDENVLPFASSNVHWSHCYKSLFGRRDGLATLRGMGPVWYTPMTMGQPHSHGDGVEEIWFALEGDITILLGKQIRKLPVGSAYKIPPNNITPHSNINNTDETIKLFWLMN